MGVYIKGMEKPKKCYYCPLYDGSDSYQWCKAKATFTYEEDCPMVEVKTPHGRLIDADALHDEMYHRAFETDGDTMWQSGCWVRYRAIEQTHDNAPTVIEAEGE